jgi:hypothetical protein
VIHKKGAKLDPPLRLDMSFEEALSRFVATKPEEIEESIERSKAKVPPQDGALRRRGRSKSIMSKASRGASSAKD